MKELISDTLTHRLDRLERENRRLKVAGAILLLALVAVGAMGCAVPYKAYKGPDLPDEQVAILDWELGFDYIMIDGVVVRGFPRPMLGSPARLLPGKHDVVGQVQSRAISPDEYVAATIEMQAGHVYVVKESRCFWCFPRRATMWIEDVTTGEVVAASKTVKREPTRPKGFFPFFE